MQTLFIPFPAPSPSICLASLVLFHKQWTPQKGQEGRVKGRHPNENQPLLSRCRAGTSPSFNFSLSVGCEMRKTWSRPWRGVHFCVHCVGRKDVQLALQGSLTPRTRLPPLLLILTHRTRWSTAPTGWLRKGQEKLMTKKCRPFSASNKAFTGEQRWFGLLTRCRLPKKTHAQIHIFQVAAGRSVAVHWSLQYKLFFLHLLLKLQIYREVTLSWC